MKQSRPLPVRSHPPAAPESSNPGPMAPWHGPGLHPPFVDRAISPAKPAPPVLLQRICEATCRWFAEWHEDLITFLVLFVGAYLILMLIGAAERADLLAGWL